MPAAGAPESALDALTPLIGSVPSPPIPFAGSDGATHLVYELWVTNFTGSDLTIVNLDVVNPATGSVVHTMGDEALKQRVQPAGSRQSTDRLTPGQSATVFIHVALADTAVPDQLLHEIDVITDALPSADNEITERLGPAGVDRRALPVLSAPLAGENYVVGDGCCDTVWHTRAILPVNGTPYLAQRFAIDYEQVDDQGLIVDGDTSDPANYTVYGNEVLAVADRPCSARCSAT